MAIYGSWEENDEGPDAAIDSSIRDYLNNVMRVVVAKCSEHYPRGQTTIKSSPLDKFFIKFSQLLWV